MTENTAFSSSGEDAIARPIEVEKDGVPPGQDLAEYYDIGRTVEAILRGGYKRIALQFPDELLHDSVPIYCALKAKLDPFKELYVLADTSYGSCCVDEVAAQHAEADAMVHYGHACMSQTSRLPVIYVFGKKPVDVSDCAIRLAASIESSHADLSSIELRINVAHSWEGERILAELQSTLPSTNIKYSPASLFTETQSSTLAGGIGDGTHEPESDTPRTILYVGGESLSLTNLLITHASYEVHSYDPKTREARIESARSNRLLMRRYAVVQRARDADVFGILIGTLGVACYLPLISRLRTLLKKAHKKSYTVTVGKLNPAKLANFLEIECFVLVACPENSLIEAKDFLRPIITPYELEVALQAEPVWSGEYVLDFGKLALKESTEELERDLGEDDGRPMFSLVTGAYRSAKRYGDRDSQDSVDNTDGGSSAVVLRDQDGTVAVMQDSAGAQFLQSRSFRGLETRLGEDTPSILEQGRSGIARKYEDDPEQVS